MKYSRKLGIFVKIPAPGQVKTRLVPPLEPDQACELYTAFLKDLFTRLSRLKKFSGTVFYAGTDAGDLAGLIPDRYALRPQTGENLGARMVDAFAEMLTGEASSAVLIGSDSPDIPLAFIKRAFQKLKNADVVLGPAFDGGYYLIGMKRPIQPVFEGIAWSEPTVMRDTLERVQAANLSLSMLPPWYDIDSAESLRFLQTMLAAKKITRADRLLHTEKIIERLVSASHRDDA